MQITLAGYNVDAEVLAELTAGQNRQDVTPETLSASYARISRDPRPINELRKTAREEVEKARKSNSTIIFKMGHHSVAEHAVFNFDILDVSRLALEEIEKFRLCSYTEKSQRYQKLEGGFAVPEEIKGGEFEKRFVEVVEKQNSCYQGLTTKGIEPEDARYITSMATPGQVGMTVNARSLELLVRRFASSELAEVREAGRKMYALAARIAPSILLFVGENDFDRKTYAGLREHFKGRWEGKRRVSRSCELVDYTGKADDKLIAALLHVSSGISFRNCRRIARNMRGKERREAIKKSCQYMEFYDAVIREFEHINLTYDLILSSACFAQMKRHRMAAITSQKYDPALGVTVPPKIKEAGEGKYFLEMVKETERVYYEMADKEPAAARYVLTGAHRKRILLTLNARELYHISRLREDAHAQWDIRKTAASMTAAAQKVMPAALQLIGGKDRYPEVYRKVYGRPPKVFPPGEVTK
ncbi:FAD-dependent thymidylate synthase [Candidatus Saganbacteria bacterium]|uniref:FAD-dependent thymidylate synthase n=1 Tax=Candidatus Saganbacteria bacterium TaxID=2575572 RepID=A0A9D6UNN5_UNCSA|nr:FAD-dependent thymidylate synthase [Candidatus Saganbacteria bacterium]